jgi:hypothetical protein
MKTIINIKKFTAYPVCPEASSKGRFPVNRIAELSANGEASPRSDWNRKVNKKIFASAF